MSQDHWESRQLQVVRRVWMEVWGGKGGLVSALVLWRVDVIFVVSIHVCGCVCACVFIVIFANKHYNEHKLNMCELTSSVETLILFAKCYTHTCTPDRSLRSAVCKTIQGYLVLPCIHTLYTKDSGSQHPSMLTCCFREWKLSAVIHDCTFLEKCWSRTVHTLTHWPHCRPV